MRICSALICSLLGTLSSQGAVILSEGFDNVAGLTGAGWAMVNNSTPGGTTNWEQGNDGVFPAQAGPANSYAMANFLNAGFPGDISNWLITPILTIQNGDSISFYTRTEDTPFPDRLEVRLSINGGSADVGGTTTSVGDFGVLLQAINPTLSPGGYPTSWTQFTSTVSGLAMPVQGRFAFRYFVTDTNTNGNYIGIDSVIVDSPVPEPATMTSLAMGLALAGWLRARRKH